MVRIGVAVLLGCSLAACGDNRQVELVGVHAGQILVPRGFDVGGAALLRAWYDTRMNVECTFMFADDGRYHCLPDGADATWLDPDSYADAACTRHAIAVPACSRFRFVRGGGVPTQTCADAEGVPVYALGEARPASRIYRDNGAGCVAIDLEPGRAMQEVGTQLSASRFVGATLSVQAATGVVAPYAFVADDGAQERTSSWDTARDGECRASWYSDEPRCVPQEIALHYDTLWSSASCSEHAAADLSQVRPCATPTAVLSYDENLGTHFARIGAEVPVAYSTSSGTCAVAPSYGDRYYVEGTAISDDEFPAMTRHLDGTERLRVLRFGSAEEPEIATGVALFDTSQDAICSALPLTDNTLGCLVGAQALHVPSPVQHEGVYADASCSTPLALGDERPYLVIDPVRETDACPDARYEVRRLGERYDGPVFQGPECTPRPRQAGEQFWRLGPAAELPTLQTF